MFIARDVKEEFDDTSSVLVEVAFVIADGAEALSPDFILVVVFVGDVFGLEDFGMDADDEDFLVVGAVENADAPALGQALAGAPKEIVFEFFGAGMFEAVDLAALGIDARHDVLNGAVFSGSIHRLENEEEGVFVVGVEEFLKIAEFVDVIGEDLFVVGF